jgi:hypothetical protein
MEGLLGLKRIEVEARQRGKSVADLQAPWSQDDA